MSKPEKPSFSQSIIDGHPSHGPAAVAALREVLVHQQRYTDASFEYVNHAGVRETRHVADLQRPEFRAEAPWYPQPVWLARGRCLARNAERSFECAKIENIRPLAAGLWAQAPDSNR